MTVKMGRLIWLVLDLSKKINDSMYVQKFSINPKIQKFQSKLETYIIPLYEYFLNKIHVKAII